MNAKSKKIQWGELLLPVIASGYGTYAIIGQYYSGAQYSSIYYTLLLSAPVWICGVIIVTGTFRGTGQKIEGVKKDKAASSNYKTMALFFAGMVAVLTLLETLGYIVCFFLFLAFGFRAMGIRSQKTIIGVSIGVLVFIYFVFGMWLHLDLPMGFWFHFLGKN